MTRKTALTPEKERDAVQAIVVGGATHRIIADQNNIGVATVHRAKVRQYAAVRRALQREDVAALDMWRVCVNETMRVLEAARADGQHAGVLLAIARLESQLKIVMDAGLGAAAGGAVGQPLMSAITTAITKGATEATLIRAIESETEWPTLPLEARIADAKALLESL